MTSAGRDSAKLARSTVVFAPHPDDETLGCGGTILLKRRYGADVRIVFMTDGARSHAQHLSPDELRRIRLQESLAACAALGVDAQRVCSLGYPDGALSEAVDRVVPQVVDLLRAWTPQEVYIPYRFDGPPDHEATNHIVCQALRGSDILPTVLEYPVWFWQHWPWTPLPLQRNSNTRQLVRDSANARFGRRLLREFNRRVDIRDVLDDKRTALACHATQTTRFLPQTEWATLADVAGGEWLSCFFLGFEVFQTIRYEKNFA